MVTFLFVMCMIFGFSLLMFMWAGHFAAMRARLYKAKYEVEVIRNELYKKSLSVYADSNHPYWIKKTDIVNGQKVYFYKDVRQLSELATRTLNV
jgi:ribosomal protein L10